MARSKPEPVAQGKCPICGNPTEQDYRPFCSRRCADVDLSRWLRGAYAIPDEAESEDGEEGAPPAVDDKRGPRDKG
ncbi:MAG: DNA gyrase inhibitor YacG [Hyphomicrobiaceae bacterium]|nr:MAG: DNA gyrase inhibitor YacG [Hyphomicrobiaceae bacterium]